MTDSDPDGCSRISAGTMSIVFGLMKEVTECGFNTSIYTWKQLTVSV